MTDEEAKELSDCGRGCYIIGGPWIAYDPDCPLHGNDARQREKEAPPADDEAVRLLREARKALINEPKLEAAIDAYLAKVKK